MLAARHRQKLPSPIRQIVPVITHEASSTSRSLLWKSLFDNEL
jgi:hypothetical protein